MNPNNKLCKPVLAKTEADHKWPREALKFDERWHGSKMKALVPSLPTGSQTEQTTDTLHNLSFMKVNMICNPGHICTTLTQV